MSIYPSIAAEPPPLISVFPAMPIGTPIDGYSLSMRAGYLLRRSHRLHLQIWKSFAPANMTPPQYTILAAVEQNPGIDQTTLGARTLLDKASVASVLSRLVARGDLLRSVSPFDSRRKVLALSRDAKRRMPGLHTATENVWTEMFAPIDVEWRDQFVGQIESLVGGRISEASDAGALFRRLEQKRFSTWSEVIGDVVTGPQYAVVHIVGQWPGVNQTELAERAALDKSTVAGIVDRLEAKDWIARKIDTSDGRACRLFLTAVATDAVNDLTPQFNEVQRRLLSPVPEGQAVIFLHNWALLAYRGAIPATAT